MLLLPPLRRRPRWAAAGIAGTALGLSVGCPLSEVPVFMWFHTDLLGTPLALSRGTDGVVVVRMSYTPFGQATVDTDPDGDGATENFFLRFPGQFEDTPAKLHYNFFRTYDPKTGRYLEADPMGQHADTNLYSYVFNNPIGLIDLLGLAPFLNSSPNPVLVRANNPNGAGFIDFAVAPGERIDAHNPGPTSDGDVDGVDFNGDGKIDDFESLMDLFPLGEKIPDTPFFPKGTGVVCEVKAHPSAGRPKLGNRPGISHRAVVPGFGGIVLP